MLALSIIACLLAALFLLLIIPARIRFEYKGDMLKADLRYLFLKLDFFPGEDVKKAARSAKRATKKELKKQEDEEGEGPKEPKAALDTAKTILTILKSAEWGIKYFFRHIVFYGVRIYISVSGPDAHQTAKYYGRLCAVIYPGLQIFRECFILKEPDVIIAPDFLSDKSRYEIVFKIRIRPLTALIALVNTLVKYIKAVLRNKKERQQIRNENRRKNYEPAASGK